MNILVIGSGGREHAMCRKLKASPKCGALYCAPGNAGIAQDAECVAPEDVIAFAKEQAIDLVIVGPEQPLVDGLADELRAAGIAVLGPSKEAARIEASKEFTKQLCDAADIPTAAYASFADAASAIAYIKEQGAPIVIKADGLAAGKGVTVAATVEEAVAAVEAIDGGAFGEAGFPIVIEECLMGEEASLFALCDGERAVLLGSAQDHKRVGEGDTGPNTGGMGTYSPAPVMRDAVTQAAWDRMVLPLLAEMQKRGTPYSGFLFAGLMVAPDGTPKLIEYNCRMGDPETQVILPRIENDFVELCYQAATGALEGVQVSLSPKSSLCVVMAAEGYPAAYEKGTVIEGVDKAESVNGVDVLHAGTRRGRNCGKLKANGGRVLNVVATADTLEQAQERAYSAVDLIDWPQGFCRRDIGDKGLKRLQSVA
jgi:phosphoribosylamine--glycine ligase